jgi:hypothetical protein
MPFSKTLRKFVRETNSSGYTLLAVTIKIRNLFLLQEMQRKVFGADPSLVYLFDQAVQAGQVESKSNRIEINGVERAKQLK